MNSRISPNIELIYAQLLWIERRRYRVVESVSAHFGRSLVEKILMDFGLSKSPLSSEPEFVSLLDERDPEQFLENLAFEVEHHEAATITNLRNQISVYREHVDEQILFGARTAGQEAGRTFLSRAPIANPNPSTLSVPEAVQAVFELNYTGLPEERNHFLVLRSHGGSTVHFARSPHIGAWKQASADPGFLYDLRCEWIRGILDIISPQVEFSSPQSIERGGSFGLEHFFLRGQHAGP